MAGKDKDDDFGNARDRVEVRLEVLSQLDCEYIY